MEQSLGSGERLGRGATGFLRGEQIQMFPELKKSSTLEHTVKVHLSEKTGAVCLCQGHTCFISTAYNKSAFICFSSRL